MLVPDLNFRKHVNLLVVFVLCFYLSKKFIDSIWIQFLTFSDFKQPRYASPNDAIHMLEDTLQDPNLSRARFGE